MNVEWLHCFLETVKQKSFSKASEKLNLSQPAISKQIRKLEEVYGIPLFKRSAVGVELTDAGKLLVDRIQPVLLELESIRSDMLVLTGSYKISIGTLPSLAAYYLPEKALRLREQDREVDVTVFNNSEEVFELLRTGLIDAAIVESRTVSGAFWTVDLFSEPYFAVFPASHVLKETQSVTLQNIKDEPLVVYPQGCDVRQAIMTAYRKQQLEPNISTEVAFGDFLLGFVAAGAGITVVPKLIAEHTGHLSLTSKPITDFDTDRTISLISRSEKIGKLLYKSFVSDTW